MLGHAIFHPVQAHGIERVMNCKLSVLLLAVSPVLCHAQADGCMRNFQIEQQAIERDMARQLPPKGDREAEMAWAAKLDASLKQAGARAEACRRQSTPKASASARAAQEACAARVRAAAEEMIGRYGGRTLSSAEQATRRAEEMRLSDDMHACRVQSAR